MIDTPHIIYLFIFPQRLWKQTHFVCETKKKLLKGRGRRENGTNRAKLSAALDKTFRKVTLVHLASDSVTDTVVAPLSPVSEFSTYAQAECTANFKFNSNLILTRI